MREVYIQYNPYKVTTEVLIDGQPVKQNSKLRISEGKRLQEWVDELPNRLVDECSTKQFNLTFHGTTFDYEDVVCIANEAKKRNIDIHLNHKPAKEIVQKEEQIAKIFEKIKTGPIDSLREKSVINAFEKAFSSDFEVNVIATMSSGKSTLVNALLGEDLMPSKNAACTAIITKIKDNDNDEFTASVYNKEGKLIEEVPKLTRDDMEKFNADASVGTIEIEGNIPFVGADDMALVLIDTPGTNNSQDRAHKETTYTLLDESSKTLILYILNATQLQTNDDKTLLSDVAKSMKSGGKQSRDRFIFVLNKADAYDIKKEPLDLILEDAKLYLENQGIENPAIYPISAKTALDIRTILGKSDDEEDLETVNSLMKKYTVFNKDNQRSFELRAPLPKSVKDNIQERLDVAIKNEDIPMQSLIHCGMISLEEAIRLYVLKYAKTAKIKNVVDSFRGKLESQQAMDNLAKEIQENKSEREEIKKQINSVKEKLNDGKKANEFKSTISTLNEKTITAVVEDAQHILSEAAGQVRSYIDQYRGQNRVGKRDAAKKARELKKSVEDIQVKVKVALDNLISNQFQGELEYVFVEYQNRLKGLVEGVGDYKLDLNLTTIMKEQLEVDLDQVLDNSTRVVREVVEERWVANTNKKWYKPWTWFDDAGYYEDVYDNVEYVDLGQFADTYLEPFETSLYKNVEDTIAYAKDESEKLRVNCLKKFEDLDKVLERKLEELESYTKDDESLKVKIQEAESRLEWIKGILKEVDAILEI